MTFCVIAICAYGLYDEGQTTQTQKGSLVRGRPLSLLSSVAAEGAGKNSGVTPPGTASENTRDSARWAPKLRENAEIQLVFACKYYFCS